MEIERLREVVIHPSANRPNQLLGGDRELVLVAALIAASLAFSLAAWWGLVGSLCFWLSAAAVLPSAWEKPIHCCAKPICATSVIALSIQ
ncbi:MAG TPA: VirB3 family type IV secretion system protein [Bryobacteraceae bacterium]|jgi:type IV secretory pathway TrbD component|nr:VirB3 family type IV secretion system protein [Bryobacteraceae bacterium]